MATLFTRRFLLVGDSWVRNDYGKQEHGAPDLRLFTRRFLLVGDWLVRKTSEK